MNKTERSQLITAQITNNGKEINNPVPFLFSPDAGQPRSLQAEIQRLLQAEKRMDLLKGKETEEEANDFNVVDDFEREVFNSQYEVMEDEYDGTQVHPAEEAEAQGEAEAEKTDTQVETTETNSVEENTEKGDITT